MLPINHTSFNFLGGTLEDNNVILIDCLYKSDLEYPVHYDRFDRISIVLSGKVKEVISKKEHYASSTSFVIKPSGVLHSNKFGPTGSRMLSLLVHPDFIEQFELESFFSQLRWIHTSKITASVINSLMRLKENQDWISEAIDLISLLSLHKVNDDAFPPLWLYRIRERINDEADSNLSVKDLAATENLHPVYMARVFRKFEGCGVKEYIHTVKMRQITEKLSDTKLPIVQIALDMGYADQSHMSRMFKNFVGVSPGSFRKMVSEY